MCTLLVLFWDEIPWTLRQRAGIFTEPVKDFRLMWLRAKIWHKLYERSLCYQPVIFFPEILFANVHSIFNNGTQRWGKEVWCVFAWGSHMQALVICVPFWCWLNNVHSSFTFAGGLLYAFLHCHSSKKHLSCKYFYTYGPIRINFKCVYQPPRLFMWLN